MENLLPSIVNNFSEMKNTNMKTCRIKYKYCECYFEYTKFKDDITEYKCLCCDKNYQKKFDKKLKERFFNTYEFSNHEVNMFEKKCLPI